MRRNENTVGAGPNAGEGNDYAAMVRQMGEAAARDSWMLKHRYGDLFSQLVNIMARHDPADLIWTGAPDDEYFPEARPILLRLDEVASEGELRALIEDVFRQMMGEGMLLPQRAAAVAAEAWPLVRPYAGGRGQGTP